MTERLDPNKSLRQLRDEQRHTERELDTERLERFRERERKSRGRSPFTPTNYHTVDVEDEVPGTVIDWRNMASGRGDDE